MADKNYVLTFTMSDGTSKSVQFTAPQGEIGQRGTGILNTTTGIAAYTTTVGGVSPAYRILLSTLKTQAKVSEVLVGDTVRYSTFLYPVIYVDAEYAYMTTRVTIQGSDGKTPVRGTDYWTEADKDEIVNDVLNMIPESDTSVDLTADKVKTALGYTPADVTDVFESTAQATFTNVFDTVKIEYGKLMNGDGSVADTASPLAITDFIPIRVGQTVRMENFAVYTNSATPCVNLYDSSKALKTHSKADAMEEITYYYSNLVTDDDGNIVEFTVNAPGSLAYLRICTHTNAIGENPVLTVDEEIQYEMGYGTKMNPNVRVDYGQITNTPQKNCWSILPYERLNICYSGINRKPVNTVEHFTDAAENFGYNALKCDVRPTSDGELVCCHDAGFTFDGNGYITTYNASNSTVIHNVTAATVLGYSFKTGEHPCLVGDYLDVCRKYGKVAFITIRNEYMDVVIPKLLEELRVHNMTYSTIINCMTYESLVQWRQQDQAVMINYTLNFGVAIDQTQIDRAVSLGYCSLCGFSLSSAAAAPSASCDFEYARANGIRLLEAIAYHADSPQTCYDMGYDGCQIGIAWNPISATSGGVTEEEVDAKISAAIGSAIGGSY